MSFGTVQAYGGSLASGVTKTMNATSYTISSPFDVKVTCTLLDLSLCLPILTPSYSMMVDLQASDPNDVWQISTLTLSTLLNTLTNSGIYGLLTPWTISVNVPFSRASGNLSDTVNLVVVAN
jgi:hypothetical protein